MTSVTLQHTGGVAILGLVPKGDRKPPTLDHATLDAIVAALDELGRRLEPEAIRLLYIRSLSPRFFCAGANVNALRDLSRETIGRWVEHGHKVFAKLEEFPVPTVARVEGFALGGGLELALACDLIFASEQAELGQPEAHLGFVTGWGGSRRLLQRVSVARAKELLFTGRRVPATEALACGLVDYCGDGDGLEAKCRDFAASVMAGSHRSHLEHKRLVNRAPSVSSRDAMERETVASLACIDDPNTQVRVRRFLESRR